MVASPFSSEVARDGGLGERGRGGRLGLVCTQKLPVFIDLLKNKNGLN